MVIPVVRPSIDELRRQVEKRAPPGLSSVKLQHLRPLRITGERENLRRGRKEYGLSETGMVDRLLGLLKVRVLRGVNLAVRDITSSDPYVILRMGTQKLKSRVIRKNINPEWNEELTLTVGDPIFPIRLEVYDKDMFSFDDPMGYAEFDIIPFVETVKLKLEGIPNGTIIKKVIPNRQNCLAEESIISWSDGKVIQDMVLRLKGVECGEVELQLQWVNIPGSEGL